MIQPLTLGEFQVLAKNAGRAAVFEEIPAGQLTPIIIYRLLNKAYQTEGVIFENLHQQTGSHYAFICFESIASLTINHDSDNPPLTALRHLQSTLAYATRPDAAHLITSAMGFMTYDAIRYFEQIPNRHPAGPLLPALFFNFYALSLAFDHEKQTVLISYVVETGDQLERAYYQAKQKIEDITKLLLNELNENDHPVAAPKVTSHIDHDMTDADFMCMVDKAKQYITRGDVFQLVLSRCFTRHYSAAPLEIYKTLCRTSPAPFMFYFPTQSGVMMGASPERFIRVHHRKITVNPIAGTRRRTNQKTDEAITADLLNDKKELAEHTMLVDLARNDAGAVSETGSVRVSELLHVKHYSHVSHITSTVTGKLKEKYDALDALTAAFPAGTLSGAPKVRAMQLIDELETSRRGLYGGAICRFDALGNLDSCIAIRMAILQKGIATVRTGAGIVYGSNPAHEARETHQKAQAILDAIASAHGE